MRASSCQRKISSAKFVEFVSNDHASRVALLVVARAMLPRRHAVNAYAVLVGHGCVTTLQAFLCGGFSRVVCSAKRKLDLRRHVVAGLDVASRGWVRAVHVPKLQRSHNLSTHDRLCNLAPLRTIATNRAPRFDLLDGEVFTVQHRHERRRRVRQKHVRASTFQLARNIAEFDLL